MIRASRRGAVLSTVLFAPVVWAATGITPPEGFGTPEGAGIWALVMSLPGLALLGAALTPAALGSRASAASAALAMGVGVPVAAVASAMIAVYLFVALLKGFDPAGMAAGLVLRDGVIAAVRVAPLIAGRLGAVGRPRPASDQARVWRGAVGRLTRPGRPPQYRACP